MNEAFALKEIMEKQVMSLAEVQEFLNDNIFLIEARNQKSRCVDGRYEEGEDLGAVARPGADAGLVMIAFGAIEKLGLNLDSEAVFQAVLELVGGEDKFQFHTDDHAEHDHAGCGMGCGHLKQSRLSPLDYGVTKDKVEFIFNKLESLKDFGNQTVLHGEHEETATIIIKSEHYSVKPKKILSNGEAIEAFVYQQTLDQKDMTRLSGALFKLVENSQLEITLEQIQQVVTSIADLQRAETLKRLTSGLPRFLVTIDDHGAVSVEEL